MDKLTVRDRVTKEVLMIIEGNEVEITEALKKKRKKTSKEKETEEINEIE